VDHWCSVSLFAPLRRSAIRPHPQSVSPDR
jgi:hypothetical protein